MASLAPFGLLSVLKALHKQVISFIQLFSYLISKKPNEVNRVICILQREKKKQTEAQKLNCSSLS